MDAGVVAASIAVPAFVAGLLSGDVVDHYDRRVVSIVSDVISAAAVAALPVVSMFTDLGVGWFVLFGIVGSFGDVPGSTARESLLLPVSRRSTWSLDRLVGVRESLFAAVMVIGPAVAVGLVTLLDGPQALWVAAGMSFLAALVTSCLPRGISRGAAAPGGTSPRTVLRDLGEGWSLLFVRSPFLLNVTVLNFVLASCLASVQGLLLPVHFTMSGDQGRLGLVLSSLAGGLLIGSGVYASAGGVVPRRTWLVIGLVGSSIGLLLVGLLPSVWLVAVGAALVGTFGGLSHAVLGVSTMERIPDELRGRVTGTQNAIIALAPALGLFSTGVLIERISVNVAGLAIGLVWATMVAVALALPPLRDLSAETGSGTVRTPT
jgi:MFS family permease